MYKKTLTKKKLISTFIMLIMVLSAFLVISSGASAQTATGTFSASVGLSGGASTVLTPLASPAPMIFVSSGSTQFTAGQTVDFYWATGTAVSTIVTGVVGTTSASSLGAISGAFVLTDVPSTLGTYYLLAASEGVLTGGVAASTETLTIASSTTYPLTLELSANEVTYSTSVTSTVTSTVYFEGSGFTSTSAITMAVVTSSGAAPATPFTITATTPISGAISGSFTITANPMRSYYVIAYDSGTSGGLGTAQAVLSIVPSVTPVISIPLDSISFTSTTLTGAGFPSTATFTASTLATPTNTLTIGGIDAILTGTPSVTTGAVPFYIIGLASPIMTTGPYPVVITDVQGVSWTFTAQAYVSSTTDVPTLVVTDVTTGTTSGYVTDDLTVTGYNLLGSQSYTVYIDNAPAIATGSTNSIGFFSTTTTALPALPGMAYTVYASVESGTEYVSTTFTILPYVAVTNSAHALNGEYAATTSIVTITATGLLPLTEYAITDTGLVTLGISSNLAYDYILYDYPLITTGELTIALDYMGFMSDGTGSITVVYDLAYLSTTPTGTSETITFGAGTSATTSVNYLAVGKVTLSGFASSYAPATTVTFTASGLLPAGQYYTTGTYTPTYYVYVNGIGPVILSTTKTYFTTTTTTATVSFIYSSVGPNILKLETSSTYLETSSTYLASHTILISTPGTGLVTAPSISTVYSGEPLTYYLYDFPLNTAVTVTYYSNIGKQTASVTTDVNGAYTYTFTVPNAVAGTYYISFVYGTTTVSTTSYTVTAAVAFDQAPFADNLYLPATNYVSYFSVYAYPGETLTFYAYSLGPPNTVYLFGFATGATWGTVVASTESYFVTDQYGNGPSSGLSLTVPTAPTGSYYILFAPYSSPPPTVLSQSLTVTLGGYNVIYSNMNYTTNTANAFPTELVSFAWTPNTPPTAPGTTTIGPTLTSDFYGPVYVTVYLNGTTYTTFPAAYSSGTLLGSFLAPNLADGSYWVVTLGWTQTEYLNVLSGGTPTGQNTIVNGYTMPTSSVPTAYLELVSGSGALLISISSAQIATIITSAVNTAMQIPVSELNAAITSLNGTVVEITTAFGTMTSTLKAINASVTDIVAGVAIINSNLGNMQTSLATLSAQIAAINGTVVTIQTALGTVTTTLSAINGTVTSSASSISGLVGSVATIQTSLGTISGTVTGISGTVATIQTNLGTLTTTVNSIKTTTSNVSNSVGNTMIFEIAVLVLILVTLAMVLYSLGRKQGPKKPEEIKAPEEEKAAEVPKAPEETPKAP